MTELDRNEHEALRIGLGAYVLGGLEPDEVTRLEVHLASCADCRGELDELRPTAALLGELRTGGTQVPVPTGLDERVAAALETEQARAHRTRWLRFAGLAAAAGAAAAAVLVVGLAVTGPEEGPPLPLEAVAVTIPGPGITADADIVAHTWGVEVKLAGRGFAEGRRYSVAVVSADGTRHPAGEFVGTGDRPMLCNLNSAVLRDRAVGFEVRDHRGRVVVKSRFEV